MAKQVIKLTESELKHIIKESVERILEESKYAGMDDSWSDVAVFGENERDIYDMLWRVKEALQKKIARGEEVSKDRLANSSILFRAAQISLKRFNEYNKEADMPPFVMDNEAKRGLREYYAQKILDWIEEEKGVTL